jgi:hypothetical protein
METMAMQIQSLAIVVLMLVGIYFRRQRKRHIKIMSFAMIWDVILILQIELSRSAILKASEAVKNTMLLNIHVSFAVSTVIFYAFMVYTGRKLLNGDNSIRPRHKMLGWTTLFLRILTFITSFWAVAPKETL